MRTTRQRATCTPIRLCIPCTPTQTETSFPARCSRSVFPNQLVSAVHLLAFADTWMCLGSCLGVNERKGSYTHTHTHNHTSLAPRCCSTNTLVCCLCYFALCFFAAGDVLSVCRRPQQPVAHLHPQQHHAVPPRAGQRLQQLAPPPSTWGRHCAHACRDKQTPAQVCAHDSF